MIKFTEKEMALLEVFAHCEMTPANTATPETAEDTRTYLWADERAGALGVSEQAVGGLLSSLQNKGAIHIEAPNCKMGKNPQVQRNAGKDPDGYFVMSDAGFEAWVAQRTE